MPDRNKHHKIFLFRNFLTNQLNQSLLFAKGRESNQPRTENLLVAIMTTIGPQEGPSKQEGDEGNVHKEEASTQPPVRVKPDTRVSIIVKGPGEEEPWSLNDTKNELLGEDPKKPLYIKHGPTNWHNERDIFQFILYLSFI